MQFLQCTIRLLLCTGYISDINITEFCFHLYSADNPDTWSMGERQHHGRSNADHSRITGHLRLQWNVLSHMMTVDYNLLMCDTVNMQLTTCTAHTCMNLHHT